MKTLPIYQERRGGSKDLLKGLADDQEFDDPVFATGIHRKVIKAAGEGVPPLIGQGDGYVLPRLDIIKSEDIHQAEGGRVNPYPDIGSR